MPFCSLFLMNSHCLTLFRLSNAMRVVIVRNDIETKPDINVKRIVFKSFVCKRNVKRIVRRRLTVKVTWSHNGKQWFFFQKYHISFKFCSLGYTCSQGLERIFLEIRAQAYVRTGYGSFRVILEPIVPLQVKNQTEKQAFMREKVMQQLMIANFLIATPGINAFNLFFVIFFPPYPNTTFKGK